MKLYLQHPTHSSNSFHQNIKKEIFCKKPNNSLAFYELYCCCFVEVVVAVIVGRTLGLLGTRLLGEVLAEDPGQADG